MKNYLSGLAAIVICAAVFTLAPAQASVGGDPGNYVDSLGKQALAAISDKALTKDKKQDKLNKIFADNVDFPWVGRFVMGQSWRQATDDQKKRYLKAYQAFLILNYTSRFIDYTGGTFKLTNTRDDGDGEFTVSMQLQGDKPDSEPVLVDYRVRKNDGGGFKIFDVIVEGVSLITTQRSEFGAVISKNGIDYLINQLATRSVPTDVASSK